MEDTPNLRIIEELQEASMDTDMAEAPMIGLQPTEENQNIESLMCNAMEDEETENEIICQTSSATGDINMSSSFVIVTERPTANTVADEKNESEDINMSTSYVVVNEKHAAIAVVDEKNESEEIICQHSLLTGQERSILMTNATADSVQNEQLIGQDSAIPGLVRDINTSVSDIVVEPLTICLPYSKYRTVETFFTIRKLTKDIRTLVVQKIPDSFAISFKDDHKFNEEDVYKLEGENILYVIPVRESNTVECFIFTICETGQVVNVKMSA